MAPMAGGLSGLPLAKLGEILALDEARDPKLIQASCVLRWAMAPTNVDGQVPSPNLVSFPTPSTRRRWMHDRTLLTELPPTHLVSSNPRPLSACFLTGRECKLETGLLEARYHGQPAAPCVNRCDPRRRPRARERESLRGLTWPQLSSRRKHTPLHWLLGAMRREAPPAPGISDYQSHVTLIAQQRLAFAPRSIARA